MTLQRLANILQDMCHHGHAQDDVAVVVDGIHYAIREAELKIEIPGETLILVDNGEEDPV